MSLNPGEQLSEYLRKEMKVTAETIEIVRYGLEVFLSTLGGILAILVIGAIFRVVPEALAAVVAVAALRVFAGGAHCSTAVRCALVSGLVFPGIGLLSRCIFSFLLPHMEVFLGGVFLVGLMSAYFLAPVDSPEKPIRTAQHRRRLRRLAMVTVLVLVSAIYVLFQTTPNASTLIVAAGFGLLWECFVLTSMGHKLIAFIDKGLAHFWSSFGN